MGNLKKILKFLEKNKMLERWNKDKKEWESVPIDSDDPDMMQLLDVMSAELDVRIKIEEMKLGMLKDKDETILD